MANQFYLMINGEEVAVTEEVYRVYKRPIWKEKKMLQRNNRCRDGRNIRCDGDCNTCEFARLHGGANGGDLSLEEHMALGLDIVADYDVLDEIAERQQAEVIRGVVDQFDPVNKKIAELLAYGYRQNEIAEMMGVSAVAVHKRIKKMRELLKEFSNIG